MVADRLTERHFQAQQDRPAEVAALDIRRLDPFLRGLLFTDGTVSRALEAQTLRSVEVRPVAQQTAPAPGRSAAHLELPEGTECVQRRVVMHIAGPGPSVWAESYVVPERLPQAFLPALGGDAQGIGGSLAQLRLESARELLWFGRGEPPAWWTQQTPARGTLTRCYRIVTAGRPSLLITESFALREEGAGYALLGCYGPPPRGEHESDGDAG